VGSSPDEKDFFQFSSTSRQSSTPSLTSYMEERSVYFDATLFKELLQSLIYDGYKTRSSVTLVSGNSYFYGRLSNV
jgi:hypothetical protein